MSKLLTPHPSSTSNTPIQTNEQADHKSQPSDYQSMSTNRSPLAPRRLLLHVHHRPPQAVGESSSLCPICKDAIVPSFPAIAHTACGNAIHTSCFDGLVEASTDLLSPNPKPTKYPFCRSAMLAHPVLTCANKPAVQAAPAAACRPVGLLALHELSVETRTLMAARAITLRRQGRGPRRRGDYRPPTRPASHPDGRAYLQSDASRGDLRGGVDGTVGHAGDVGCDAIGVVEESNGRGEVGTGEWEDLAAVLSGWRRNKEKSR